MFEKRGNPSVLDVADFLKANNQEKQTLEIILALAVKTLSNYANHIFGTEVDELFKSRAWTK